MLPEVSTEKELVDQKKIVRLLKNNGIKDPAKKKMFLKWVKKQEQKVNKAKDPGTALIKFNLRLARLYYETGYTKVAIENYKDVPYQTKEEGQIELQNTVKQELEKIKNNP